MPNDEIYMRRALALARETIGLASPNPQVGCVLVRNGNIVGEGAHLYDQLDHAEIVALKQAGELARSATAYVTLEPCSHHGRTGPCADALIARRHRALRRRHRRPQPACQRPGHRTPARSGDRGRGRPLPGRRPRAEQRLRVLDHARTPVRDLEGRSLRGRHARACAYAPHTRPTLLAHRPGCPRRGSSPAPRRPTPSSPASAPCSPTTRS